MKKIVNKILAVAVLGVSLSSCNLDLYPEATRNYDDDTVLFELDADVEGAHNAVYTYFRSTVGGGMAFLSDLNSMIQCQS